MKIFVTGCAGMIGSNLVRKLTGDGVNVIGIDNFWRGSQANLDGVMYSPFFEFRHADISSDDDWYHDLSSSDVLVHVADVVAGIGYVFRNEWSVFRKNILINSKIAHIVSRISPFKVIYLGTACSYPQKLQRSVTESVLSEQNKFPADPESGYGWSKLMGEVELTLAVKGLSTKLVTLDLHNVYGAPCVFSDPTAQAIPSLINRALISTDSGEPLVVWGNGNQGRAFLHVDDVVDAVQRAIRYNGAETSFMIGPSQCTTIKKVVEVIQEHPDIRLGGVVFDASKPTGDIGRYADFSLARAELGWEPQVEFKRGVHDLVDWIRSRYSFSRIPL
jgi:GDP-D-mannose 3',5'-epimerase